MPTHTANTIDKTAGQGGRTVRPFWVLFFSKHILLPCAGGYQCWLVYGNHTVCACAGTRGMLMMKGTPPRMQTFSRAPSCGLYFHGLLRLIKSLVRLDLCTDECIVNNGRPVHVVCINYRFVIVVIIIICIIVIGCYRVAIFSVPTH